MSQTKKLPISRIRAANKEFSKKEKLSFSDGKHHIHYYTKFKPSLINDCLTLLFEDLSELEKQNALEDVSYHDLILFYAIMTFTTLDVPEKLEERLGLFEVLIESEYAEEIIDVLDINEIKKVYDRLGKIEDLAFELQEQQDKLRKTIDESPLENRDLLFKD